MHSPPLSIIGRLKHLVRANARSLLKSERLDRFLGRLIALLENLRFRIRRIEMELEDIEKERVLLLEAARTTEEKARNARAEGHSAEAASFEAETRRFRERYETFDAIYRGLKEKVDDLKTKYRELEEMRKRAETRMEPDFDLDARFHALEREIASNAVEDELQELKKRLEREQ